MPDNKKSKVIRARDLNLPFEGTTGKYNAITDVEGVEVGFSTIISGENIRTGVTAIFPRGKKNSPVFANWYSLNGNGEMTGTTWITESGFLETPILLTNTNSVGIAHEAMLKWFVEMNWYDTESWYIYPVVSETYDGRLNDIKGFHIKEQHVIDALNNAKNGIVEEGNVGGGTGAISFELKGGTGTSSRVVAIENKKYTVGVLVQSNFGMRDHLTICGKPIGKLLKDQLLPIIKRPDIIKPGDGSIVVIVSTDAPLLPHQLKRLAARVPIGIGLTGGKGNNGSGDIFLAFSTANKNAFSKAGNEHVELLSNNLMDPLFEATIQCVEESIINAMVAAETMKGFNGNTVYSIPNELIKDAFK